MNGTRIKNLRKNKREMKAREGFEIINCTAYPCKTGKHHPVSFSVRWRNPIQFRHKFKYMHCCIYPKN